MRADVENHLTVTSALSRLWSRRRSRPWLVVCATVVLAALLAYPAVDWYLRSVGVAPEFRFWDFGAYDAAIYRWQHGQPLYRPADGGGYHGGYLYPPVALFVFWPFAALPPTIDAVVWGGVSVAFLWVALQALVAAFGVDVHPVERLLLLGVVVGFQPVLLSIKLGQASAFLAGLLTVAAAALVTGEYGQSTDGSSLPLRLLSGAATALAGILKLAYAPVGAHLLVRRARFVGAVVTSALTLLVSVVVFGIETHLAYLDVLRWGVTLGTDARSPIRWLAPHFVPLFALPTGSLVVRLVGALVVAVLALCSDADCETFALGVVVTPLLAPEAYTYTFVVLLPAVVVLVATELDRGDDGYPAVPVLGLGLLHVHAYGLRLAGDVVPSLVGDGAATVVSLLQPGLWGVVVLGVLAAGRVAQTAAVPTVGPGDLFPR